MGAVLLTERVAAGASSRATTPPPSAAARWWRAPRSPSAARSASPAFLAEVRRKGELLEERLGGARAAHGVAWTAVRGAGLIWGVRDRRRRRRGRGARARGRAAPRRAPGPTSCASSRRSPCRRGADARHRDPGRRALMVIQIAPRGRPLPFRGGAVPSTGCGGGHGRRVATAARPVRCRPAPRAIADMRQVEPLINRFAQQNLMLPKTHDQLARLFREFVVAVDERGPRASAAARCASTTRRSPRSPRSPWTRSAHGPASAAAWWSACGRGARPRPAHRLRPHPAGGSSSTGSASAP